MDFRSETLYRCTNPRLMWRASLPLSGMRVPVRKWISYPDTETGEICWKDVKRFAPAKSVIAPLVVRCGKCEHCRKQQNDEWASRMIMEQISHPDVVPFFVTLSFDPRFDDDLKALDKTIIYREFVVPFKKRLRSYGFDFRFYCVSELGEIGKRFHFHLIIWLKLDDDIVASSAMFCDKYAPLSSDYFETCRLFVKGSNKKYRLQTDLECYVQYLIQRAWSDNVQRFACAPVIKIHYKHGQRVKSVEYPNQLGWVSCSQAEGFGSYKYITSYALKCIHDGVTTYHRQSPGIGSKYVEDNIRGSLDMLESGKSIPDYWTYGQTPFLLPRFFIRKFMPVHHRLRRFWDYYASLPFWSFIQLLPRVATLDNWSTFVESIPPQSYMIKPGKSDLSLPERVWLETLDQVNDIILSRRAKKVDVHRLYNKNLSRALCIQSKKTDESTSEQLTLF